MFIAGFLAFPFLCFALLVLFCLLEHLGILPAKVNVVIGDWIIKSVMSADDVGYAVARSIMRAILFFRGFR